MPGLGIIESLKKAIQDLEEEYAELGKQLSQKLEAGDRLRIDRRMKAIEEEIQQKQNRLERLANPAAFAGATAAPLSMPQDINWPLLLRRIKSGKCTPFLGPGVCSGIVPPQADIAREWALKRDYPFDDAHDLARVAQFMAIDLGDDDFPKEEWMTLFKKAALPDSGTYEEPHHVLAALPLPLYITTNHADFMFKALQGQKKDPRQEMCRWKETIKNFPSIFEKEPGFEPTPANPVVFHLCGCGGKDDNEWLESLVLTEDDYLDFLVNLSMDPHLLPKRIQEAIGSTSLLFLGYRLMDWEFRVLLRIVSDYMKRDSSRRYHVSVQFVPEDGSSEVRKVRAQEYLKRYFGKLNISVYWGTCRDFATELIDRWEIFEHGN